MVLFSPQVRDTERIAYQFQGEIVRATFKGVTDEFDFSEFPDGELEVTSEFGDVLLETALEFNPILAGKKENGNLYLTLMNFIGLNATEEERFPKWIDHTEYIPLKVGEEDGQDEVEK